MLEIGCGLGLSSIVLHQMGMDITASDYHPLAKEFLDRSKFTRNMIALGFSHEYTRFNAHGSDELSCKGRILHYWR